MSLRKIILIMLSSVLGFILAVCGIIYGVYMAYTRNSISVIDRPDNLVIEKVDHSLEDGGEFTEVLPENEYENIDKVENVGIYEQEIIQENVVNILLIGLDSRNYSDYSRSDTIMLASYNKDSGDIKLLSFMRDSWVFVPGRHWGRINSATAMGGPGLLINTINENFQLDIQNYVQVKFEDFITIVNMIGGIDVALTRAEIDYINGKLHMEDHDYSHDIKAKPGMVHLNGEQALWHCRNRTIGQSDYSRTERQRTVVTTIIEKMKRETSVGDVANLVYTMKDYVNTNMDLQLIIELGISALIQPSLSIETERVPFDDCYWPSNKNGASVLEIDVDANTRKIHEFIYSDEET